MKSTESMRLEPLDLFNSEGRKSSYYHEILLFLAMAGPSIKNEVAKSLGKREGDISKRIDWLMEFGFLEVAKRRTKKSKYRTIRLKEYRPTMKGLFAISHFKEFDPSRTVEYYDVPKVGRYLLASLGSDRVRLYLNRVANKVKESIDTTPSFEEIEIGDEALLGPLLRFGLEELPALIDPKGLDQNQRREIQEVLVTYSDFIVPALDEQIGQWLKLTESLELFQEAIIEAKKNPKRIQELLGVMGVASTATEKGI